MLVALDSDEHGRLADVAGEGKAILDRDQPNVVTVETALTAADMHLYAAVARYRHGQLLDDKNLMAKAHGRARRARDPERIAAMVAPG